MADRKLYLGQDEVTAKASEAIRFDETQSLVSTQQDVALGNINLKKCITIDLDHRPSNGEQGTFTTEQINQLKRTDTPLIVIRTKYESGYYRDFYYKSQQYSNAIYLFKIDCDASQKECYCCSFGVSLYSTDFGRWTYRTYRYLTESDSVLIDTGVYIDNETIVYRLVNWSSYTKYDANPVFVLIDSYGGIFFITTWNGTINRITGTGSNTFEIKEFNKTNKTFQLWPSDNLSRARLYCFAKQKGA